MTNIRGTAGDAQTDLCNRDWRGGHNSRSVLGPRCRHGAMREAKASWIGAPGRTRTSTMLPLPDFELCGGHFLSLPPHSCSFRSAPNTLKIDAFCFPLVSGGFREYPSLP